MKRDMKLIREIMEQVERSPNRVSQIDDPEGYTRKNVNNHLVLMKQAELIGEYELSHDPIKHGRSIVHGLTWSGYDLLEKLREEDPS